MMGLRAENDHASTSFYSGAQNRKTYRFAEKYHGRFFVSGVSGSFQKYTKQLKETDKKYLKSEKPEKKYTFEPLLEKHQKEELRRDAQRLLEMEEQLAQLQKMRELKRKRDRDRRKKKLEFMSACCIQRSFRAYLQYKVDHSADVIVSFLRTMAARQALSAASWASKVIKRFAIKASYIWKERQFVKRKAQLLARESWNVIREVASIWTLARRATTDEFVFNCLKEGSKQATQAILDSGVLLRPKKSKQVKKKHVSGSSKKQRGPKEDHLAFFLTEFDNNDENSLESADGTASEGEEGSEDEDDERFNQTRKSIRFINKTHSSVEDLTASAQEFLRLSKRSRPVKVYDESRADHKRIIEMHKKRLNDFKLERMRRMQAVDQKADRDEKESAEKAKQEEAARREADRAKREYQAQLAQEAREKARKEAKLRIEREAAKVRRQALEKQQQAERAAMQIHDKTCYQNLPSASAGGVGVGAGANKVKKRPVSGRVTTSAGGEGAADWAVVPEGGDSTKSASGVASDAPAPPVPPKASTSVKIKPKPVVDQVALDNEYYHKALPPKRPHVPRVNTDGGVSKAKQKQLEEQEAIEKEALIQLEIRRQKYTSDEAIKRSRLAVQRRVAAKAERVAQKAKESEDADAEKKEKMQQIAVLAAERLKADLEKKKKKEADRRHKLGIATPPDFFSIPSVGMAGKQRKRRKHKKHTGEDGSDVPMSESETDRAKGEEGREDVIGEGEKLSGNNVRRSVASQRYASANNDEDGEGEGDLTSDEGHNPDEGEEENMEYGMRVAVSDTEGDGDAEMSPINPHAEEEGEEGNNSDDSDSLDAMLKGLSKSLRQQNEQPVPKAQQPQSGKLSANVPSTRSSSAGANSSPQRLNRNTASGGTDTRTLTADRDSHPSQQEFSPRTTLSRAFERADITSAHEHFEDLMENFQADDFFAQSSVVRLLHTNASGELVEGQPDSAAEHAKRPPAKAQNKTKAKLSTGATKKVVIPKHLQNTPYFKHYQKHTEGADTTSALPAGLPSQEQNEGNFGANPNAMGSNKTTSKVPLLARKKQLASELQSAAMASSVSAPVLLDESMLKFQQSQQMKPGKVASLMEMVSKARIKLKNGGTAMESGTEASETETDAEPHKVSHAHHPAAHSLNPQFAGGAHPSMGQAASTSRLTPPVTSMNYKIASDAELDAFVPSLAPPTVPQALPVLSFSRKTQGPSAIPLPPLSKDNLAILFKGKDPDALLAQQQAAKPAVKKAPKKPKEKAVEKVVEKSESKTIAALQATNRELAKKRAAAPKIKTSSLTRNLSKTKKSLTGRYAQMFEEDDDEDLADEEFDPHTFSPDQRRAPKGPKISDLATGKVRFAPSPSEVLKDSDEENEDEHGERVGASDDEADQLQAEYSRLRNEFNAKLQQAAAFNQVRSSTNSNEGAALRQSMHAQHRANDEDATEETEGQYYYEGEEEQGQEEGGGVEASGSVTMSYSEGIPKISTQDLLAMWAIEDAEEDSLRRSESQNTAQRVSVEAREQEPPGSVHQEPTRRDANIRVPSKQSSQGQKQDQEQGQGQGVRRSTRYAQYDHEDSQSEEEEEVPRRGAHAAAKPSSSANTRASAPAPASAPRAVPTTTPSAYTLDDDAALSFMNKMNNKLPVPQNVAPVAETAALDDDAALAFMSKMSTKLPAPKL